MLSVVGYVTFLVCKNVDILSVFMMNVMAPFKRLHCSIGWTVLVIKRFTVSNTKWLKLALTVQLTKRGIGKEKLEREKEKKRN
jgi:hypothetical protein